MKALRCINPVEEKFQKRLKWTLFWLLFLLSVAIPIHSHAALGGYEVADLYQDITNEVDDTNELISKALKFSTVSPYDIINKLTYKNNGNMRSLMVQIHGNSKTVALVVATFLLFVEFFRKSVNFEWSSKWENILIFLVKVIAIKQIVQNCDVIISHVYVAFSWIVGHTKATSINFISSSNVVTYVLERDNKGDSFFQWAVNKVTDKKINQTFRISRDTIKMFYDVDLPDHLEDKYRDIKAFGVKYTPFQNFIPMLDKILKMPYFLAMKAMAIMVFVIIIGRAFELGIYTLLAPLPMATFASETTHDIAKNFIKKYIAVILQVAVILVMFGVYTALKLYIDTENFDGGRWMQFVAFMSLGLGVMKSGAWAKSICGVA